MNGFILQHPSGHFSLGTRHYHPRHILSERNGLWKKNKHPLYVSMSSDDHGNDIVDVPCESSNVKDGFDLTLALWCAGLAFDAYAEPSDSSRWEKGSKGTNVAFLSNSFTRSLYSGLFEITPLKCTDLPNENDTAESLLSGDGVDAYMLCAVVEGEMEDDIKYIEEDKFNKGVVGLTSSAHVGRSLTAWSNVDEKQAKAKAKKDGNDSYAYSIPSTWNRGGQAVWINKPFYIYVSNPARARLVFTIMDEDLVGEDDVIGSVSKTVLSLLPNVGNAWELAKEKLVKKAKSAVMAGEMLPDDVLQKNLADEIAQCWEGDLKLQTKPKNEDKGGQVTAGAVAGAMIAGPVGAAAGGLIGRWVFFHFISFSNVS